jgi:hypothetical protein
MAEEPADETQLVGVACPCPSRLWGSISERHPFEANGRKTTGETDLSSCPLRIPPPRLEPKAASWANKDSPDQNPPAGVITPDILLGIGHFPSVGARFPRVVYPVAGKNYGKTEASAAKGCLWPGGTI